MNAEQFFNNGFGADVEKVHRKHVIELMTNFAKHYHTEQCNIADVSQRSELFFAVLKWAKQADLEYPDEILIKDFEQFTAKNCG